MVIVCKDTIKWKYGNTDKVGFYLDGYVKEVCDAVVARVSSRKQDILMLFAGQEGSGKTGASINCAYYIAEQSGRTFTEDNVFFNIDKMMEFAGNSEKQVIIWDESALGGLAASWSNASQVKLKSMLMVCRKLQHVFMFNIPRFYRLSRDLIERAYCMFQVYEDDTEKPGNFMFFGRDGLENLFGEWKKTNRPNYYKYSKFYGHFLWRLPYLINEEVYEKRKTAAIQALVDMKKEDTSKVNLKKDLREFKITNKFKELGLNQKDIAEVYGVSDRYIRELQSGRNIRNKFITTSQGEQTGGVGEQDGSA